jgi:uncharacterized cupredoxin-like copper-binding protein
LNHLRIAMASAALAAAVLVATPVIAASDPAKKPAKTVTVKVTAKDFSFKLSKTKVKRGTKVVFKMVNKGEVVHDFEIVKLHKKTRYATPGKTAKLTIKFTKKGTYKYICTVPRHASLGMQGNFKVT